MRPGGLRLTEWSESQRPHESNPDPAGDIAFRQLRVRYDRLRDDYEVLLDRLAELEARIESPQPTATPSGSLRQAIAAPLVDLRREYLDVVDEIQGILATLNELVGRGLKGQHAAAEPVPAAAPEEAEAEAAETPTEPETVELEVEGGNFGSLLDFQQQLSQIEGVAQVSIRSLDRDRATLIVELQRPPGQ